MQVVILAIVACKKYVKCTAAFVKGTGKSGVPVWTNNEAGDKAR